MTPNSSSQNAVPPIPPNCPYFRDDEEGLEGFHDVFLTPDWECDFPWAIRLDKATAYQRPIIAAVAEVAWLREAERLQKAFKNMSQFRPDELMPSHADEILTAKDNARAWRDWSKS